MAAISYFGPLIFHYSFRSSYIVLEARNGVAEADSGGVQASHVEINDVRNNKKKNLTDDDRLVIWQQLLLNGNHGKLATGAQKKIRDKFNISERTIRTIWLNGKRSIGQSVPAALLSCKMGKAGRRKKVFDLYRIKLIPFSTRRKHSLLGCLILDCSDIGMVWNQG